MAPRAAPLRPNISVKDMPATPWRWSASTAASTIRVLVSPPMPISLD
jgi:hypothetical protein